MPAGASVGCCCCRRSQAHQQAGQPGTLLPMPAPVSHSPVLPLPPAGQTTTTPCARPTPTRPSGPLRWHSPWSRAPTTSLLPRPLAPPATPPSGCPSPSGPGRPRQGERGGGRSARGASDQRLCAFLHGSGRGLLARARIVWVRGRLAAAARRPGPPTVSLTALHSLLCS